MKSVLFDTEASFGTSVEVTHGKPLIWASTITIPKPSYNDGNKNTSIAWYKSLTSVLWPKNLTYLVNFKDLILSLISSIFGPCPIKSSTESLFFLWISLKISTKKSWFFWATNLPMCPTTKVESFIFNSFLLLFLILLEYLKLSKSIALLITVTLPELKILFPNKYLAASSEQAK